MLKVPFAWDLRKHMEVSALSFRAAAAAGAANIVQQDIDISEWALSTANKFLDSHQKATALSSIARELGDSAYDDQAMQLLVEAFSTARLAGKETVLKVLADGAEICLLRDFGSSQIVVGLRRTADFRSFEVAVTVRVEMDKEVGPKSAVIFMMCTPTENTCLLSNHSAFSMVLTKTDFWSGQKTLKLGIIPWKCCRRTRSPLVC